MSRLAPLQLADMNDDALRLILDAIGNGDMETACRSAKKWCDLDTRHRRMCQEGGDALWNALTTRVFGNEKIGVADAHDAQKNFYALCKRAIRVVEAKKWIITYVPERVPGGHQAYVFRDEVFLGMLGEILEHIDNNDVGRTEPRVRLVEMMQHLFHRKIEGFTNADLLKLYSMESLYAMVEGAVHSEIDAALALLRLLANDNGWGGDDEDDREGYVPEKVPVLKRLLWEAIPNNYTDRAENILGIWNGLLIGSEFEDDESGDRHRRLNDMARYARAMIRYNVGILLVDNIKRPLNDMVRDLSAAVMLCMSDTLNASLTVAMHDASRSREGFDPRMELVYGRD